MPLLPNAEFVCSSAEWGAATGRRAALNGYSPGHLPSAARMRFLDFDREGEGHGPFTSTVDLFGDGSIRLISTPGHTRGHTSVLVRLPHERQVLLVGDAAYTRRSIADELLPFFTFHDGLYGRSIREIKAWADSEAGASLVPSHDPTAWKDLRGDSS
jgi:N-acyl homoserine lactone hydrolase